MPETYDAACICIPSLYPSNTVQRCDLNSTILPSVSSTTPSWVTSPLSQLFTDTIATVKTGKTPAGTPVEKGWSAQAACNAWSDDGMEWTDGGCSLSVGGHHTGFAMLGYHPFGAAEGNWLTQVAAPASVISGSAYTESPACGEVDFYISIAKIDDLVPFDGQFGGHFVTGRNIKPHDEAALCRETTQNVTACGDYELKSVPGTIFSRRTLTDIYYNGVDLPCSMYDARLVDKHVAFGNFGKPGALVCRTEHANSTTSGGARRHVTMKAGFMVLGLLAWSRIVI